MLEDVPTDVWSTLTGFLCDVGELNARVANKNERSLMWTRSGSLLRRKLGIRTRSGRRSRRLTRFVATSATTENKFRRSSPSRECVDAEPRGVESTEAEICALQLPVRLNPFARQHAYLAVCFVTTSMQFYAWKNWGARARSCGSKRAVLQTRCLSNHSASWRNRDHECCSE
jgi:hypothetical protein